MTLSPHNITDSERWNSLLQGLPAPHLLQSWQWGLLKSDFGWDAERWAWTAEGQAVGDAITAEPESSLAAAQVLTRQVGPARLGLKLAYCPRGPTLNWSDPELRHAVLSQMLERARNQGAFLLRIDPEVWLGRGEPGDLPEDPIALGVIEDLRASGWVRSKDRVQFDSTLMVDLEAEEDDLLAAMKQKTRYNVRLATKHSVQVRRGGLKDLNLLYNMYAETSVRDGFVIRDSAYYRAAWGYFMEAELAQPFIAEVEGEPVAGLVAFRFGETAWYLYGMSRSAHREKMPNYLLQWEAMRWAKESGCRWYDFVGAPDKLDSSDPLWGLYRFKQGFGSQYARSIGAWERPLRPLQYWSYRLGLPPLLAVMRARGRRRTQQAADQPFQ